jgi:pimeloyl-ACP methyl ester carboxylesterase
MPSTLSCVPRHPLLLPGPVAGSSLGGWLALQLAVRHPERVAGLLLLAPALDFTERLWASLSAEQQAAAQASGRVPVASK